MNSIEELRRNRYLKGKKAKVQNLDGEETYRGEIVKVRFPDVEGADPRVEVRVEDGEDSHIHNTASTRVELLGESGGDF